MEQLVLFSPLLGAIICGFGHRYIGEMAATIIATSLLFFAAFLSWIIFINFYFFIFYILCAQGL